MRKAVPTTATMAISGGLKSTEKRVEEDADGGDGDRSDHWYLFSGGLDGAIAGERRSEILVVLVRERAGEERKRNGV